MHALQAEENEMIWHGNLLESERLSPHMAQSLDNGQFWFCLAATSSFGFDDIYWKFIDPVHYGEFTAIEDRIGLLIQQEQDDLKPFVQLKMQQREDADLEEHRTFNEMFYA
ncbi:hypothetical protein MAP00_003988 [Monascus purpureus]|nr:hypothetical protein MAP00_003988 [Monascus purpureus]